MIDFDRSLSINHQAKAAYLYNVISNSPASLSIASQIAMGFGKVSYVVLVTFLLGIEAQGFSALTLTLSVAAGIILSFGIEISNARLIAENKNRQKTLLISSFVLSVAGFACGTALIYWAAIYEVFGAENFFGQHWQFGILVGVQIFHVAVQGLLIGLRRFRTLLISNVCQFLMAGGLVVVAYVQSFPYESILLIWLTALLAKSFIMMFSIFDGIREKSNESPSNIIYSQFFLGMGACVGNLMSAIMLRVPVVFLASEGNLRLVGLFSILVTIAEAFLYLPKAFGNVIISSVAYSIDYRAAFARYVSICQWLIFIAATGVLSATVALSVYVYDGQFENIVLSLTLLLIGVFVYSLGILINYLLFGLGRSLQHSVSSSVACVVGIVCGILLIPNLGIVGASSTMALTLAVYSSLVLKFLSINEGSIQFVLRALIPGAYSLRNVIRATDGKDTTTQ